MHVSCYSHCDYNVSDENIMMVQHFKQIHNHLCDHCNQAFTQKSNLLEHQRSLHILSTDNCRICEQNFATTDELAIHMKEEHSQICGIFEETFATRSELVKPVQVDRKAILY